MKLSDRARVFAQLGRAVWASVRYDTRYPSPVPETPRFMSARAAVNLIRDGDVFAVSGLGGNQRASIVFWAIRDDEFPPFGIGHRACGDFHRHRSWRRRWSCVCRI